MKKPFDVPPELSHLIEKREKEDRRSPEKAQGKNGGQAPQKPAVERRKADRRKSSN